ncbi:MAG TPA: metallophosphoesterase [Thermoanaerobaculia bacterium]
MASRTLRVLLLADTHLGLRRAGVDHDAAYQRALLPAFRGEVDLVVHGGDVFFRSRVKPGVVFQAFEPLKRIADSGIRVVVVPGNHERSAIPYPLLAAHPGIHVFDRPRTFVFDVRGLTVAVAGFPNDRDHIRERFSALLEMTDWRSPSATVRLLCMHQTVEGATVGPAGFMFYSRPDVIRARAFPSGFAAVLSGHIHRHQVLTRDLEGRALAAPVFYPGSTERTSGAERNEAKGYVTMEIDETEGGRVCAWSFHELDGPRYTLPAHAEPT